MHWLIKYGLCPHTQDPNSPEQTFGTQFDDLAPRIRTLTHSNQKGIQAARQEWSRLSMRTKLDCKGMSQLAQMLRPPTLALSTLYVRLRVERKAESSLHCSTCNQKVKVQQRALTIVGESL